MKSTKLHILTWLPTLRTSENRWHYQACARLLTRSRRWHCGRWRCGRWNATTSVLPVRHPANRFLLASHLKYVTIGAREKVTRCCISPAIVIATGTFRLSAFRCRFGSTHDTQYIFQLVFRSHKCNNWNHTLSRRRHQRNADDEKHHRSERWTDHDVKCKIENSVDLL